MEKLKRYKGITLIVLVITIIILLILAGITISSLTNSGLFDKVKEAKEKWKNAQNEEEMQMAKYSNEIDSYVSSRTMNSFQYVGAYVSSDSFKHKDESSITISQLEKGNYLIVCFRTAYNSSIAEVIQNMPEDLEYGDVKTTSAGTLTKVGKNSYTLNLNNKSDITLTIDAIGTGNPFGRVYAYIFKLN